MKKVTFKGLDPENMHTCQHCQHSFHDIVNGKMCEYYGHIPTAYYIQVNDCGAYKSPYMSDYRRRTDMERQLRKESRE